MILPQNYSINTTKTSFKCFTFIYITIINTNKTQPATLKSRWDEWQKRRKEKCNGALWRYRAVHKAQAQNK